MDLTNFRPQRWNSSRPHRCGDDLLFASWNMAARTSIWSLVTSGTEARVWDLDGMNCFDSMGMLDP